MLDPLCGKSLFVFLSRVLLLSWEGAVVESFQDSALVGVVLRASLWLYPVLRCMIPLRFLYELCLWSEWIGSAAGSQRHIYHANPFNQNPPVPMQ